MSRLRKPGKAIDRFENGVIVFTFEIPVPRCTYLLQMSICLRASIIVEDCPYWSMFDPFSVRRFKSFVGVEQNPLISGFKQNNLSLVIEATDCGQISNVKYDFRKLLNQRGYHNYSSK